MNKKWWWKWWLIDEIKKIFLNVWGAKVLTLVIWTEEFGFLSYYDDFDRVGFAGFPIWKENELTNFERWEI